MLKHGRDSVDIEDRLERWTSLAAEVAGAASGLEALTLMLRYLPQVSEHATRACDAPLWETRQTRSS